MSVFVQSDGAEIRPIEPACQRMDTRGSLAMTIVGLCVYFPPLALPVGALAAGAAISATRKHLAG